MSDRPFKVLGIQQVAIGGLDKEKMRKLWIDSLGLTITGNFKSERENVDEDIAAIGAGPLKVEVDLMQPVDPEKKPAVHNTPLNHIGLWIDDLPAAVEWLSANGVRFPPGGIRKGAAGFGGRHVPSLPQLDAFPEPPIGLVRWWPRLPRVTDRPTATIERIAATGSGAPAGQRDL